jgi:hypothetical protein
MPGTYFLMSRCTDFHVELHTHEDPTVQLGHWTIWATLSQAWFIGLLANVDYGCPGQLPIAGAA